MLEKIEQIEHENSELFYDLVEDYLNLKLWQNYENRKWNSKIKKDEKKWFNERIAPLRGTTDDETFRRAFERFICSPRREGIEEKMQNDLILNKWPHAQILKKNNCKWKELKIETMAKSIDVFVEPNIIINQKYIHDSGGSQENQFKDYDEMKQIAIKYPDFIFYFHVGGCYGEKCVRKEHIDTQNFKVLFSNKLWQEYKNN